MPSLSLFLRYYVVQNVVVRRFCSTLLCCDPFLAQRIKRLFGVRPLQSHVYGGIIIMGSF